MIEEKNYQEVEEEEECKIIKVSDLKCWASNLLQIQRVFNLQLSHVSAFDILIELNENCGFKGFDLLHSIKPVYSVKQKERCVMFIIPEKESQFIDLQISINLLQLQDRREYLQLSADLKKLIPIIQLFEIRVNQILVSNDRDHVRLIDIKRRRQSYLQDLILTNYKLKQSFANEFSSLSGYSICLSNKSFYLSILAFSKAMVHLFGVDEEQMIRLGLQQGKLDKFSFESRFLIQKILLDYLIDRKTSIKMQEFEVVSYDDISIRCPAEFEIIEIKYPSDLQYDDIQTSDFLINTRLQIDAFHIKKVLGIRQRREGNNLLDIDYDFEYSMRSEIFLQRYYQSSLRKIQQGQSFKEGNEKLIQSKTCNIRTLNAQQK